MDVLTTCLLFVLGLLLIIKGGDWFIDAASWVAKITGMPDILIGATIVSLGTTFPELMVSATSAIQGHGDMALGNAIGSTICNIGLILGVCNVISPTKINSRIFNIKAFIMVFYIFALLLMSLDGKIGSMDTVLLILGVIVYVLVNYLEVRIKKNSPDNLKPAGIPAAISRRATAKEKAGNILKFFAGAFSIVAGARLLVDNGIVLAAILKVPDVIISLTFIALGTSLPELVTSVTALVKGHRNLSVGNIIGANIINISMVIGTSSIFRPLDMPPQIRNWDLPFSILMIIALTLPSFVTRRISRVQAAVLLALYGIYIFISF